MDTESIDAFTEGYIECLFFTEVGNVGTEEWQAQEEHDEGSIPNDVGYSDIAPDTLARIIADCKAFQEQNASKLETAYEKEGYTEAHAGHDFWLTRNGHGAGFWDRGLGMTGDLLTAACKQFGEVWSYLGDDGKVHLG